LALTACTDTTATQSTQSESNATTSTITQTPTTTAQPTATTSSEPTTTTSTIPERIEVVGVVIAVEGNLQGTDSFTIVVDGGTELVFLPEKGLLFDGGPLSHLRDHLTSGSPVGVSYSTDASGNNIAHVVGDA
jgi:hypothetical protein